MSPTYFQGVPRIIGLCAFAIVCLAPFLFGAVQRSIWIPLFQLWMVLGFISHSVRLRSASATWIGDVGVEVSRSLLPLHALFALQLLPLPGAILKILSPGSFAAHFLPDPGDGRLRPLSVSPGATVESWLYVVGLQGLFLSLCALSKRERRACLNILLGVIVVLGAEGLWQSRSERPYWLLGHFYFLLPDGLDTGVFGPYFNRNHFATVTAGGAGLATGLAAAIALERGSMVRVLAMPASAAWFVLFSGSALFLALTSAASGSRSGVIAAVVAMGVIALLRFGKRIFLLSLGLGMSAALLTGSAALERLTQLDFMASRILPWRDMIELFRFFPVLGCGLGAFGAAYRPYQTNVAYEYWQYAHNEYLQVLIEAGLPGVMVALWVARALRKSVGLEAWLRDAALGAGLAFATQAVLDFPFRIPANAAILTCVLGLVVAQRKPPIQ